MEADLVLRSAEFRDSAARSIRQKTALDPRRSDRERSSRAVVTKIAGNGKFPELAESAATTLDPSNVGERESLSILSPFLV